MKGVCGATIAVMTVLQLLPASAQTPPPLPFQVPAGWQQMPSAMTKFDTGDHWTGRSAAGGRETFGIVVLPLPFPVTGPANHRPKARQLMLCGYPASLSTTSAGLGSKGAVVQQESVMRGGYTSLLVYSRPFSMAADPNIERLFRTFCPGKAGALPSLVPPSGWKSAGVRLTMTGMWVGKSPMQTMALMRGPAMPIADLRKAASLKTNGKGMNIAFSTRRGTLCGNPALFVTTRAANGGLGVKADTVLTTSSSASYSLAYTRVGSIPDDPAALRALQTLCAGAAPSPTPAPSTSP